MAKFTFYFLVILFIAQKCPVSLADDSDERVITEITEFLQNIATSVQEIMEDVSIRLPQAVTQFEINLKQNVDKLTAEELADHTQTAMARCISESRGMVDVVRIQLQDLLTRAGALGSGATAQIEACVKTVANQNDVAGLASCIKQQGSSIQEAVDELRNEIESTLVLAETVVADVSRTLDACMEQAETQNDDETYLHTIDEL